MVEEPKVMACWRVEKMPNPQKGSTRGHHCDNCNAEIWIMPKNLPLKAVATVLCRECVQEKGKLDPPKVVTREEAEEWLDVDPAKLGRSFVPAEDGGTGPAKRSGCE